MDENHATLYIPLGVKTEAEFFPGFGKKQMVQAAIGSLFFGLVAFLIWLVNGSVSCTVVTILSGIAGSVMMTAKDSTNLSVVDQCVNMFRFVRGQKYYPYRYGEEWGV
ncbi:hypothetical protein [Desulfosporosinus lacus]|uniref:PrgI family protein n=1 Tax=Desulfosporosinus lacus DSM 15449 TaxID=1121420 RepID=A0A1M5V242_9FIRM|nr:hypothetical protein [Desulfosporosinus lacus]SHH69230.1 hypothetical protein SAMN02746098_01164 [Desulfosporosinus lacus DSM 15449]